MSFDADSKENEITVNDLLRKIITRLDVLIRHNEEINDEIYKEEDING